MKRFVRAAVSVVATVLSIGIFVTAMAWVAMVYNHHTPQYATQQVAGFFKSLAHPAGMVKLAEARMGEIGNVTTPKVTTAATTGRAGTGTGTAGTAQSRTVASNKQSDPVTTAKTTAGNGGSGQETGSTGQGALTPYQQALLSNGPGPVPADDLLRQGADGTWVFMQPNFPNGCSETPEAHTLQGSFFSTYDKTRYGQPPLIESPALDQLAMERLQAYANTNDLMLPPDMTAINGVMPGMGWGFEYITDANDVLAPTASGWPSLEELDAGSGGFGNAVTYYNGSPVYVGVAVLQVNGTGNYIDDLVFASKK